jgi:hypothetical protein
MWSEMFCLYLNVHFLHNRHKVIVVDKPVADVACASVRGFFDRGS